jgi:hypothetical protein
VPIGKVGVFSRVDPFGISPAPDPNRENMYRPELDVMMAVAEAHHAAVEAPKLEVRSFGVILLAGLLIGVGLFTLMVWVLLIPGAWVWSLGIIPASVGTVLLFLPQSGADGG